MAESDGIFGEHSINYFNGGLFDSDSIIATDAGDIGMLHRVATNYDWSHSAPAIGAHYTSEDDILLLIEPVVKRPLSNAGNASKTPSSPSASIPSPRHPQTPSP